MQGHWQPAGERYSALVKIDRLDSQGQVTRDYQAFGVVLVEHTDMEQYRRYCELAVTNFAATPNSSILLACMNAAIE